jgi:flagellar biosynthesis/type III secretory pathway M-ring protein FliF/YscJ
MYQPEDDFNIENLNNSQPNKHQNIDRNLSVDSIQAHQQQIKSIFVKLIVGGLVGGVILSIGVVILLNKLGLTDKPSEMQPQQRQQLPATEIDYKNLDK